MTATSTLSPAGASPLLDTAARWEVIAARSEPGSERRYYAEQRATRFRQAAEYLRDDRPAPALVGDNRDSEEREEG